MLDLFAESPGAQMADWGLSYMSVQRTHLPSRRLAKGQVPKTYGRPSVKAGRNPDDQPADECRNLHAAKCGRARCAGLAVQSFWRGVASDGQPATMTLPPTAAQSGRNTRGARRRVRPKTLEACGEPQRAGGDQASVLGSPTVVPRAGSHNGNVSAVGF